MGRCESWKSRCSTPPSAASEGRMRGRVYPHLLRNLTADQTNAVYAAEIAWVILTRGLACPAAGMENRSGEAIWLPRIWELDGAIEPLRRLCVTFQEWKKEKNGSRAKEMVEAAGVEPASENIPSRPLRAYTGFCSRLRCLLRAGCTVGQPAEFRLSGRRRSEETIPQVGVRYRVCRRNPAGRQPP